MEKFQKGEIVLYKNYIEEPDWQLGFYIGYDDNGKADGCHIVNCYLTTCDEPNEVFAIDKYRFRKRYVRKLPHINFGNEVVWGKEEHAD